MRKLSLSLVVLAAILLTACKTASPTPEATAAPTQVVTDTAAAAPTSLPSKIPADCTVSPVLPAPDPAFVASLPPVTEQDWMLGPASAQVTLIEYTDYQ